MLKISRKAVLRVFLDFIWLFFLYKLFFFLDHEGLAKCDRHLAEKIQARIHQLQNPSVCNPRKFLLYDARVKKCNFGCKPVLSLGRTIASWERHAGLTYQLDDDSFTPEHEKGDTKTASLFFQFLKNKAFYKSKLESRRKISFLYVLLLHHILQTGSFPW